MPKTKVSDVVEAVKGTLRVKSGKGDKASANPTPLAAKDANTLSPDQAEAAMNLGDDDLLLFCIIEGETETFMISVEPSSWRSPRFLVGNLKEKIQEQRKHGSLAGVDAHSLVLWKPKEGNSIDAKPKQTLPGRIASAKKSGEELEPTDTVLTVFPGQPLLDHLHIVVRKQDTVTSPRSHSALPSGSKSGPHEKPAIENAWKMDYRGDGAALFKSGLDNMNESRRDMLYANFVPIVQSSGMGKSRLVDETAKLIFTIPFCFRTEADEADESPRDFFRLRTDETFDSVFDRCLLFLEKLFIAVNSEVNRLHTNADPLPLQWYNHLLLNRNHIYKGVVSTTENCVKATRTPHYPVYQDSKSKRMSEEERPVYLAAEALIQTIKSHANRDTSEQRSRPVRVLVYIDESHEMTAAGQTIKEDGRNVYEALCSSLNELLKLDLFFVFLSTNSMLSDYSPSGRVFWSKRGQNSTIAYIQTPYTELPFDVWQESHLVSEGEHTMDHVCSVEFIVRFGRPLWWTRWEAGDKVVRGNLINFAMMKLAARNPGEYDAKSFLAALSVRLMLDFEPRRISAMENENLMVAGHLRVANVIPSHREYIISSTPSEPIVAEAAAQILQDQNLIQLLFDNVRHGLIEKGQRGELVARLLLTLAHDAAVRKMDIKRRSDQGQIEEFFTTPIPLLEFFSALFAEQHMGRILNSRPDNQPSGPTFKQSFADAYVMFTHFGEAADDWCISDTFAFMALCRNMAISCRERMKFADLCIPIHFGRETALSRDSTSAIFVSIKDKEKVMGYNRTHIDVNKMKFFTGVDKNQPVINLVLQLGVQADGQYMPIIHTKAQQTPGLFATPERRGRGGQEVPVTPVGISVLLRPLNTDEPKTRAKDTVSGPAYYTIDARGCNSQLYGVVHPKEEPLLHDLLASRNFLSEHGRQDTGHLSAVLAQKPIWTRGQECCSWANLYDRPPQVLQEEAEERQGVLLGLDLGGEDNIFQ